MGTTGVPCGGCGMIIPSGHAFCDNCKKYVVKCENCGGTFHERYIYEWRSKKQASTRWVCARCLARLRDENAMASEQVAAFREAMQGKAEYSPTDIRKLLHAIDPATVAGFVQKAKMENVIRLDSATGTIRVDAPNSRQRDELSRRFENWLLFGSPTRDGEEPRKPSP